MTTELWTFLGVVVGCGAFWEFLKFLLARRDEKKKQKADKSNEIAKTVSATQKALTELSNAVSTLQKSVDQNNKDMSLQSEALMAIAQDRIIFLAREFCKQGWIYEDDLNNLHRLADAYRDLHGNGEVKILMDMVDKLPVKIRE